MVLMMAVMLVLLVAMPGHMGSHGPHDSSAQVSQPQDEAAKPDAEKR